MSLCGLNEIVHVKYLAFDKYLLNENCIFGRNKGGDGVRCLAHSRLSTWEQQWP